MIKMLSKEEGRKLLQAARVARLELAFNVMKSTMTYVGAT